jgi:hypothetical protein
MTQLVGRERTAPWLALPVLMAGTYLIVLDFFIVNVAIPSIQRDLHASASAVLITAGNVGHEVRYQSARGLRIFEHWRVSDAIQQRDADVRNDAVLVDCHG